MVKLFVGNLAEGTKSEALRELFKMFGTITEADVIKDFGFVHMESEDDAEAAIKSLNGYALNGRDIVVEKSRSLGPGRGGGRGRGGGPPMGDRGRGGEGDRYDRYPRRDERDSRDYKRPYDRKDDYRRDDYRRDPLPPRDLPPRDPYVASSRDRYAPRDPYPPRDYPPRDAYPPRERDPYYGGRDPYARGRSPPRRSPPRRSPPGYPRERSPAYGPPPTGYYGADRRRSPPPRGRSRSPLPPARGYDDFDRRPPRDYVPAMARSPGPPVERNGAPPRY